MLRKSIYSILLISLFLSTTTLNGQDIRELPEPQKQGGKPLMEALQERQSSRAFANKTMNDQMLSNLLWAAYGINRPGSGKRTAPSSHNVQDIQVYAATADGAFLYLPEKNALRQITAKDVRGAMGLQDFVGSAAVNLVYVSDFSKYSGGDDHVKMITAAAHTGFIGQNVYLFCASEGLNTVFRAMVDKAEIIEILELGEHQHVMYSQSVGFPK